MVTIQFLLFAFLVAVTSTNGAKLVVLLPVASRSHKNVLMPLVEELASRGHDLTVISPYKASKVILNVTEVVISGNKEAFSLFQNELFNHTLSGLSGGFIKIIRQMTKVMKESTDNFFRHPFIQSSVKSKKQIFDLAIIDGYLNEMCFMVAPLIAKNIIVVSPGAFPPQSSLSPPIFPSSVPLSLLSFPSEMTFSQRLINSITLLLLKFVFPYFYEHEIEKQTWKYIPHTSSIKTSSNKFSYLLNNADPVMTISKAQVMTSIDVGGMHCNPAKRLAKEFIEFIESGDDEDVIIFSLGSIFPAKTMSDSIRYAFVSAFHQMKRKIIWKFEDQIENLSSNVMIAPWIPQQDLLGHPKVRLFISHGGLLSIQEALYHGVPLIGIPLFGDQPGNVERLVELGLGKRLNIHDIKTEVIMANIHEILSNQSYAESMKRFSAIMRDQTEPPVKRAAYYVEYVLRHSTTIHLQESSNDLNILHYLLIDVILAIIFIFAIFVGCIAFLTKFIRKIVCTS